MNPFKKLAGDTAIYGMSSIIGRFLNWWLVPYYSRLFLPDVYGIVTNLYSYVAFFLVLLTYGLETGFFRYASNSKSAEKVFSTSMISLTFTTFLFVLIAVVFKDEAADLINYPGRGEYILWMAIIVGIDAITAIPFAKLRLENRPIKFAFIKMVNIGLTIGFNLFFLSFCPWFLKHRPDSLINLIYSEEIGVGYVFISNLLASVITFVMLLPDMIRIKTGFDRRLWVEMLSYSFPILIVGLAGMVNQNIDKILIPFLVPEDKNPMFQVGIYGANYKLAVLMNMFIQAFRYAFEPFFFSRGKGQEDRQIYADVMKYFVLFGLIIFLGIMLYIDLIKYLIDPGYHEGLKVIPLVLLANFFMGIYFALSLWYKLKDMTRYGAYISILGAVITLAINIIFIPVIGYMASAIAVLICFVFMTLISYILGQKYYPVPYNLKLLSMYFFVAMALYFLSIWANMLDSPVKYLINSLLFFSFLALIYIKEKRNLTPIFKFGRK